MTFDEFWKQSGWGNPLGWQEGTSQGTAEYNLAVDAYNAGQQSVRAEVAAALEELRGRVQVALTAEDLNSNTLRQEIMIDGIDAVITKLGLAPTTAQALRP